MIQMVTDGENKDKPYDEISDLLKKYYKPEKEIDSDKFWDNVEKKIDSLFHKELYSDRITDENGRILTDEERYWIGLDEYLKNQTGSIKHKTITEHLLGCKECRSNYNNLLDKKKLILESRLIVLT